MKLLLLPSLRSENVCVYVFDSSFYRIEIASFFLHTNAFHLAGIYLPMKVVKILCQKQSSSDCFWVIRCQTSNEVLNSCALLVYAHINSCIIFDKLQILLMVQLVVARRPCTYIHECFFRLFVLAAFNENESFFASYYFVIFLWTLNKTVTTKDFST